MNVILTFFLVAFTGGDEVLPAPNLSFQGPPSIRSGPLPSLQGTSGVPSGYLANLPQPPVLPSNRNSGTDSGLGSSYDLGWQTDQDGIFSIILQISPDAIASFAHGASGQELPVDIPYALRSRAARIVVRVGNGPVEKNPPDLRLSSTSINAAPYLTNIDQAPEVKPVSGGNSLVGAGASSMGNLPVLPNQNNNSNAGVFASTNNQFNSTAPGRTNDYVNGSVGSAANDRFSATSPNNSSTGRSLWDSIRSNSGSNASSYVNPGYSGNGNASLGMNNGNGTGNRVGTGPYLAQNPNPSYGTNAPNDPTSLTGVFPGNSNYNMNQGIDPNQTRIPGTGLPQGYNQVGPNQNGYAPLGNLTANNNNGMGFGSIPSGYNGPSTRTAGINAGSTTVPNPQDPNLGQNSVPKTAQWLPLVLLVSIVSNVYLALWMGHLRSKYRQLLSNMRGVPIPD
jgi:hypothetical protein